MRSKSAGRAVEPGRLAQKARMNLHINQRYGEDVHHAYESVFKGVAKALYMACAVDPRVKGVPSSKGKI